MVVSFWAGAVLVAASIASAAPAPSFCQKMAAELPMKEKRVAGTVRAFDMQSFTAVQRWLLGGTTHFTFKVEPIIDSPEEDKRIEDMCIGVPCTLEGPLRMTFILKDGSKYVFEAEPGERARIEYVGTRIRCSDLAPAQTAET